LIFVDSNVPMYLVGDDPSRKAEAQAAVGRLGTERRPLVTDAEVFQEILHRFVAIRRHEAIQPAFDALIGLVDEVLPVTEPDVFAAKDLVVARTRLSARDAIHAAVMQSHGITRILTFDRGFDQLPWIRRLPRP
jgi:uncharacterized protein